MQLQCHPSSKVNRLAAVTVEKMMSNVLEKRNHHTKAALAVGMVVALTACGGGNDYASETTVSPAVENVSVNLSDQEQTLYALGANDEAIASHIAVELDGEPEDEKPAPVEPVITPQDGLVEAYAAAIAPTVYTPAQIRAAYKMPAMASLADQGAGQTIYIVSAFHNPTLIADLNRFNEKYGLPGCTFVPISVGPATALPPAPKTGCTISQVVSKMSKVTDVEASKIAYNVSYARESALDVQWAHATAPMARIVVIESLNSFVNELAAGVRMANAMGPGVVSMSFCAGEGSWTEPFNANFKGNGMLYFAAGGDRGAVANWPATSPEVIAVGGTSLQYTGSDRVEETWGLTGGAFSAYFAQPTYQSTVTIASVVTSKWSSQVGVRARASSDVAFNADPKTGQVVVFTQPEMVTETRISYNVSTKKAIVTTFTSVNYGTWFAQQSTSLVNVPNATGANTISGTTKKVSPETTAWYKMGGTSIGTPQWAGIAAIANAHRAEQGKSSLSNIHSALYSMATDGSFNDVTVGSNGSAAWANAASGYDVPTGLGTPNVTTLLPKLVALN
jgi:subtilase family serine protease